MNSQETSRIINEARQLAYHNPVILNMLTLLAYYAEADFVVIFKVMAGPLAGGIIGEIIDEKRTSGRVIPVQEAVRRALQKRLQKWTEEDKTIDRGIRVSVTEGLSYTLYKERGTLKVEEYDKVRKYLDRELYGYAD